MVPRKKHRRAADGRTKRLLALAAKKGWETRRANEKKRASAAKKAKATRETSKAIATLLTKAKQQARQSKATAKRTRAVAAQLKAELKLSWGAGLAKKRELAKRAARTVEHTRGPLPKLAPESERVELAAASHYPEGRVFKSGHAFRGYLEGRPGVQRVLSIAPLLNVERREVTEAMRERAEAEIESTDAFERASLEEDDLDTWLSHAVDAYLAADDGGAFIESDVDSDSAGSDA